MRQFIKVTLFVAVFVIMKVSETVGWGYRASDQRRWARHHAACAGRQQSPIAISSRRAVPLYMPAVEMVGYHNPLPAPLTVTNNGHSVTLTIPKFSREDGAKGWRLPYVFGGRLEAEYELEGLHFHWGDRNNRGSEHVLNDVRLPMEMHIIHRNRNYPTLAEALQHPDGLVVLGFFYQVVEEESKALAPLVRNLTTIEQYNSNMTLDQTFALSSLLEGLDADRFYTYRGSLTTPPCSEAVTWVIFPDLLSISVFQMEKFRTLSTSTNLSLVDNFRHLQPLYGRRVFVRVTSRHPRSSFSKLHYSKWDWVGATSFKDSDNEVNDDDE